MHLVIRHEVAELVKSVHKWAYRATYRLIDGVYQVTIPSHLAMSPVNRLAGQWFALFEAQPGEDRSVYYSSCGFVEDEIHAGRLASGLTVSSSEPLMIAAFDQQVKRACALIALDIAYADYLENTPEQVLDLSLELDLRSPVPKLL